MEENILAIEENKKLYMGIYNDILQKIKSGRLKPGDKLPSEPQLAIHYGVSRITIGHALKMLENINLIYRIKKSGTFVNGKKSAGSAQRIVPVILPYEENFNIGIIEGAQNYGLLHNCFTPFFNSFNSAVREREILSNILNMNVDGVICYPCSIIDNLDLFVECKRRNIPLVFLDHSIDGFKAPLVCCNNEGGMFRVTEALIRKGHRKIAYFSVNDQMISSESERLRGYLEAMIQYNLPVHDNYVIRTQLHSYDNNLSLAKQKETFLKNLSVFVTNLQQWEERPTAICCVNDVSATTLSYFLKETKDPSLASIEVTGFDNLHHDGAYITVQQDFNALGSSAIKTVLDMLNGIRVPNTLYTDVKLIDKNI